MKDTIRAAALPSLFLILPALPAPAQGLPDFEGFSFSWYTQPGKYKPGPNRALCCPSPDKKWKKVLWSGHPSSLFLPENVDAYKHPVTGRTNLSLVAAPGGTGKKPSGAEVESAGAFDLGSFRVHMATPPRENDLMLRGTTSTFYLRVAGKGEIGLEIRSMYQGLIGYQRGLADLVIRDFTASPPKVFRKPAVLYFDPSTAFHSFGFDRSPGRVDFYADSARLLTVSSQEFPLPSGPGRLLLSHWTGDSRWTGLPPKAKRYMTVDWVSWTPVLFTADRGEIPLSTGGRADFFLQAGSTFAKTPYLVLASFSEVSRPVNLGNLTVPLSPDAFTLALFGLANSPLLPGFQGVLSARGTAKASFLLPPGLSPLLKGRSFRFVPLSLDPVRPFAGNPLLVKLVP